MRYSDSTEDAARLVRAALPLMAKNGIPADPHNYAVWYLYASRCDAELVTAIDEMLRNKVQFTPEICNGLYQQFVAEIGGAEVQEMCDSVAQIIDDASDRIGEAGQGAAQYGAELGQQSQQLSESLDVDQLRNIISSLVSQTQTMVDNSRQMHDKLSNMTSELDNMREQFERAKAEAKVDPLTGLANRKGFDTVLEAAVTEALETGQELCLIMADIDHFKNFNDTHGHIVGDQVLRYVGATLQNVLKGRDLVARYGGEEFGIVLPNTPIQGAQSVAEDIRASIAAAQLKRKSTGDPLGTVTMSLGVTQYVPGESLEDLIHRADEALYRAKDNGRNRVESRQQAA